MDANEARDALDQIAQTRHEVAERSQAPRGYYAAIGFVQALFITSFAVVVPWNFLLLVPGLVILGVTVGWYRGTVGTWSMANLRGQGSWLFWLMVAVTVAGVAVAITSPSVLVAIIAGAVVFVAYAVLGPIWDRAYQRQVSAA